MSYYEYYDFLRTDLFFLDGTFPLMNDTQII